MHDTWKYIYKVGLWDLTLLAFYSRNILSSKSNFFSIAYPTLAKLCSTLESYAGSQRGFTRTNFFQKLRFWRWQHLFYLFLAKWMHSYLRPWWMVWFHMNYSSKFNHEFISYFISDLFRHCGSQRKRMARFPDGSHNETWLCSLYYQTIAFFLEEVSVVSWDLNTTDSKIDTTANFSDCLQLLAFRGKNKPTANDCQYERPEHYLEIMEEWSQRGSSTTKVKVPPKFVPCLFHLCMCLFY